ncbi:hypothetical protein AX17_002360 [Amanita inopinata Kibby_2008]|nr:hypothetical protein AX17_002360 [Amanita inopinata Kibby_2008]
MPSPVLAASAALSFLAIFYIFCDRVVDDAYFRDAIPDTSQYKQLQTLSKEQFPTDDPSKRIIIVGDVHGSYDHLQNLLTRLSYNSTTDTLLHVGDVVTKGAHQGSLDILSFLSSNNVLGVRGNQDQKVIEWRGWINWILSKPGGHEFLRSARHEWENAREKGEEDLEEWNDRQRRRAFGKSEATTRIGARNRMSKGVARWWRLVPNGWMLFSDAYTVASDMPDAHYEYMLSMPLKIYVPHAHLFLAHAGLLSHDPTYDYDDPRQPLARVPDTSRVYANVHGPRLDTGTTDPVTGWLAKLFWFSQSTSSIYAPADVEEPKRDTRREKQERAVLDMSRNTNPWVPLNLRGVRSNGKLSRGKKGTPWAEIWNTDMDLCHGFDNESGHDIDNQSPDEEDLYSEMKRRSLPCRPMSVVYGHSAARGLDVKRWTFGLDTGCVYGNRLTALVLDNGNDNVRRLNLNITDVGEDNEDDYRGDKLIPFGDSGQARVVSVSCKSNSA